MTTPAWFQAISLVLGLILGSFYNVCIYRHVKRQSVVHPGSQCPYCGHDLSWWENIPLLSFVLLHGHCRSCKAKIPWRYPLVEAISGLWAWALALQFGPGLTWFIYLSFGGLLIVVSFIDLDSFILPDCLTLPGLLLAPPAAVFGLGLSWPETLIGAGAGGGGLWLLKLCYKGIRGQDGLGSGDIRLLALLGGLLGWQSLPLVLFLGSLSALAASGAYLFSEKGQGLQTAIPFGPFLSLGGMLSILFGPQILAWYLG